MIQWFNHSVTCSVYCLPVGELLTAHSLLAVKIVMLKVTSPSVSLAVTTVPWLSICSIHLNFKCYVAAGCFVPLLAGCFVQMWAWLFGFLSADVSLLLPCGLIPLLDSCSVHLSARWSAHLALTNCWLAAGCWVHLLALLSPLVTWLLSLSGFNCCVAGCFPGRLALQSLICLLWLFTVQSIWLSLLCCTVPLAGSSVSFQLVVQFTCF